MQATLEKNHLLTIENPTLDTGRTYQQDFQGLKITEENKLFFVLHKKEIKLIELKNIGSTMGVFYIRERALFDHMNLVPAYVHLAGEHFGGFDEETGERYHFLPYFSPQRVEETNKVLEQIGISFPLSHTTKGVVAPWTNTLDLPAGGSIEELLSHFFWLLLLYGKFEAKQRQLNSIKIQIPLLSAYAELHEVFQKQVQSLQSHGIFLQSSLNQNGSKTTLQITSNDYELLQIFAEWYSPIEKFTQITKKEQAMQVRDQLLAFITQGNLENKAELTQLIQQSVVKILVK